VVQSMSARAETSKTKADLGQQSPMIEIDDKLVVVCSCSYLHHAVCFTFHPTGPRDRETFEAYVQGLCLQSAR
jgi:hypothetical protein